MSLVHPALGQAPKAPTEPVERPISAGRVTRVFDFEEYSENPSPVPRFWVRAQDEPGTPGTGFPAWNRAELSYKEEGGVSFEGLGSVRLPTSGGSTRLRLEPGVIPIFAGADYLISGRVMTRGLTHARARMRVRLLDATGRVLPESEWTSPTVISEGVWTGLSVEAPVDNAAAAYLQIDLELLQPDQYAEPVLGKHQIVRQDVSGAAWFDNVATVLLPRVELTTQSRVNVICAPELPLLKAVVRDLTGETLRARIDVLDVDGVIVARHEVALGTGITEASWVPALTRLGWYRAVMDLISDAGRVGSTHLDFLWLPAVPIKATAAETAKDRSERERFGLVLRRLPASMAGETPELVTRVGAGAIVIPVWEASMTPEAAETRTRALMPTVDLLLKDWRRVTLSLPETPASLCKAAGLPSGATPLEALVADQSVWMPYLGLLLDKYGQRVRHWQIGAVSDDAMIWRPTLREDLRTATGALATLVSGPIPVFPMPVTRAWPGAVGTSAEVVARVPEWALPDSTRVAVALWRERRQFGEVAGLSLAFEPLDLDTYGSATGVPRLARHVIEAWVAGGAEAIPGLWLREPWAWPQGRRARINPTPELAGWRNLADRLVGRRVVGQFPAGDGIVCHILAPKDGGPDGAFVLWRESPAGASSFDAYLGEGELRIVDLYGNERPPERLAPESSGKRALVRIPVTTEPVFVEGVDVQLARFFSSVRVESEFIETGNERHERDIVIENPWSVAISGTVTITEPGGFESDRAQRDRSWKISPRVLTFSVGPRATERLPFTIAFSTVEEAGRKPFVMRVDLASERAYGTLEIQRSIEIGRRDVRVELSYRRAGEGGKDLIVEALVANATPQTLNIDMTAFAPGLPRSKASILNLDPGHQTVKRFTYVGGGNTLRGQRIVVSVVDADSDLAINDSIRIE
jgi:hypothetical protein